MANPYVIGANVASKQSVYELSTTRNYPLGTRGVLGARSFRYARFTTGTAIGPNKLAQMVPPVATHVSETGVEQTAGNSFITITPGANDVASNQYADGYFKLEGGTLGIGQLYTLRAHPWKVQSASTTFDIYDTVITTSTGSEVSTLIANEYADLVIQPTSITAPAAGVPLINVPASSTTTGTDSNPPVGYQTTSYSAPNYTYTTLAYGWVQSWGICSVLLDTTAIVAGSGLIVGAVAGSVGVAVETDIKQRVGVAMEAITTDNIYMTAYLQIAP